MWNNISEKKLKSEIQNEVTKGNAGTRIKSRLDNNRKHKYANKIKRSNTKLVLVQANSKLQYLPSIGANLSLKESLISSKKRKRQLRLERIGS